MPLQTFTEGQAIKASETNANNQYLLTQINNGDSALSTRITSLQTSTNNSLNEFSSTLSAAVESVEASMTALEEELNAYPAPTLVPLIDWNALQELSSSTVRATNATTGITYFTGSTITTTVNHRSGDIILKEDFTNYPRLLVLFTNSSGSSYIEPVIWETWELDYILSTLPNANNVRTNLLRGVYSYNQNNYWSIYGYNFRKAGYSVYTKKDYLMCDGYKNAGLIEIYGLSYETEEEEEEEED